MNIFVTVGAQIPFDRLVVAVAKWAASNLGKHEIFAQVGEGGCRPRNIQSVDLLEPSGFKARVLWADVLVAHAGMGSILTALQFGKPILVMPRKGSLQETRNDHQVATAIRWREMGKIAVAMDENEMPDQLNRLSDLGCAESISDTASEELIAAIRGFIRSTPS